MLTGCRSPLRLDVGQIGLLADVVIDVDPRVDICSRAIPSGVTLKNLRTKVIDRSGNVDCVALARQLKECAV